MPLLLIPGIAALVGAFGGYTIFKATDDTVDSVGNAGGKIALAIGVGILGYLILKKQRVL